ncbi:MAG: hypothetical protein M1812_004051 [Candelaria pacifica]|nr:MAG: hypothetical protein M1812_004051 [Candelaria pacifica]
MSTTRLSSSSSLRMTASIFALIWLGFGIKFTIDPRSALSYFEFPIPTLHSDAKLADNLIVLYAVRDLFMGVAVLAAAYFGDRKTLGWMLIAGGGVAFADGAVCKRQVGKGEWNHWGYGPIVAVVGSLLLGVLDRA